MTLVFWRLTLPLNFAALLLQFSHAWSAPKAQHIRRQACRPQGALLSRIGHSGSFKVILIGVGKNPERGVVRYNNVDRISETYKDIATGNIKFVYFNHPAPRFRDHQPVVAMPSSATWPGCQTTSLLTRHSTYCHVNISLGRPPSSQWNRRPGRPRNRWVARSGVTTTYHLRISGGVLSIVVTAERHYGDDNNNQQPHFDDGCPRKAFEYLQMIYIARN